MPEMQQQGIEDSEEEVKFFAKKRGSRWIYMRKKRKMELNTERWIGYA